MNPIQERKKNIKVRAIQQPQRTPRGKREGAGSGKEVSNKTKGLINSKPVQYLKYWKP